MRVIRIIVFLAMVAVAASGCVAPAYVARYEQVSPRTYAPTSSVEMFVYSCYDMQGLYESLFSDFMLIGRSAFTGAPESAEHARAQGMAVGADIVVVTSCFERRDYPPYLRGPRLRFGWMIPWGPYGRLYMEDVVDLPLAPPVVYGQEAYFLKNVGNAKGIWQKRYSDFPEDGKPGDYGGVWENQWLRIRAYASGGLVVGVLEKLFEAQSQGWESAQVKFVFDPGSGRGVYVMTDRTPMPSKFSINRFGHLTVELGGGLKGLAFERSEPVKP